MGHGGTLDPMATGVLILGVGSGTKQLHHFTTECIKSYEATVLFGTATDTYDTEGKIVGKKPYEHITREMVEEALHKFRGKGSQKPPIFSALRMQGKRLYEYAREGKELPEEIKEREVEVHELEMLEWKDGGTHEWHWPDRESGTEEKHFAEKILKLDGGGEAPKTTAKGGSPSNAKRKRDADPEGSEDAKRVKAEEAMHTEPPSDTKKNSETEPLANPETKAAHDDGPEAQPKPESQEASAPARPPCPAPACRIRMTVTSGFYVRSLCHDLGATVGSLGMMASLVRTRQGDFALGSNVLWYDELKQGEDVWGPKVKRLLHESNGSKEKHAEGKAEQPDQSDGEAV